MSGADFKLQCIEAALKYFEIKKDIELSETSLFLLADAIEKHCNEFLGNK